MTPSQTENNNFDLNLRKNPTPETVLEEIGVPFDTFAADAIQSVVARRAAAGTARTSQSMGLTEPFQPTSGQAQLISPEERSGIYHDWVPIRPSTTTESTSPSPS